MLTILLGDKRKVICDTITVNGKGEFLARLGPELVDTIPHRLVIAVYSTEEN